MEKPLIHSKDLDADPDYLRGGPSHGYTTGMLLLVYKKQVNRSNSFELSARADKRTTYTNALPSTPGARV